MRLYRWILSSISTFIPSPLHHVSLQTSKEDLLQADFEGALKFFRVQLPKRYRAAENARRLMEQACNIKVREKHAGCSFVLLSLHMLTHYILSRNNF